MDHLIKYIIVIIFDVTLILHNHESNVVHVFNSRFLSTSLHDRETVVIMLVPEIVHEQSLLLPTQRSPDAVFVSG